MKFRGLDSDGDWMLGQGLGSYAKEADALALDIAARLRSWKYDCFFALDDGVDYRNLLEKGQKTNLLASLQDCLQQTPGVVKINSFNPVFDPKTRLLHLTAEVQTIFTRSFRVTLNNITGATSA